MTELFKQCELNRAAADGLERMVSWIPARIAVAGAVVRLKDPETGRWTHGWAVEAVGETAVPGKLLERTSRDHLRTREASDI